MKIILFLIFVIGAPLNGEDLVSNLTTIPRLNNSIFASGLEKLEIKVNFNNSQDFVLCQWNVWMDIEITIFFLFISCPNTNCKIMGKYYIFNLTITDPIPHYLNVTLSCFTRINDMFSKSWLWESKDCENITSQHVDIKFSGRGRYNTPGTFSCLPNGSLRYLNNSLPTDVTTSCLANAKWDKEELFQCWRVPVNVALLGSLEIFEGNSATFECSYTDVNPNGNESAFFYDSNEIRLEKGKPLSIENVSRDLNKKTIFCQAITPYTETDNSGRSSYRTLTVFYMPTFKIKNVCIWTVGIQQTCNIHIDSNPQSSLLLVERNGVRISPSINGLYWEMNSNQLSLSKNEVLFNDSGNYRVTVFTPQFDKSSSFSFTIYTNGTTLIPVSSPVDLYPIIGGCVGGILLILFIIVIVRIKGNNADNHDGVQQVIYKNENNADNSADIQQVVYENRNVADNSAAIQQTIYQNENIADNSTDGQRVVYENENIADNSADRQRVVYENAKSSFQTNDENNREEENQYVIMFPSS